MADLKFGGVTPGTGDIKVGSSNASKIYQGSTLLWPLGAAPQPGEVTICDLIWTKTNSTITATTTGGTIPITTDATGWGQAIENQQPAACWYKNDQATYGYLGLYYNKFCLDVIQPPAGFRLPTKTDWTDTRNCIASGQPQINYANQIVNNYYDLWPSAVNSLSDINTIDFNSIGGGSISASKFSGSNYYQSFWNTDRAYYWHSSQTSTNPRTALGIIHYYSSSNNYVYLNTLNSSTGSSLVYNSNGFNIRFVKDLPALDLYDNDTQTGPTVSSITESILSPPQNSQGQRTFTRDAGSVIVPSGGGDVTLFQYLDNSTLPNITDAHFGVVPPNSTAIVGGAINVYPNANRYAFQIAYTLNWSNDNQGGVWSPDGFANRKTGTLTLPQGTWYLELQFFGEKTTFTGQVEFFTGLSV